MLRLTPTRCLLAALALGLCTVAAPAQFHHGGHGRGGGYRYGNYPSQAAPIERRPAPGSQYSAPIERRNPPYVPSGHGMHLNQWMAEHGNLTPDQQQQALAREPGFRSLSPDEQQHIRNRLAQLDAMPPGERRHMLDYTEAMERLNPAQRADVRGVMGQLGALPPDQRHFVARSFRELRMLPPDQQAAALASGRYNWMNPQQRATLDNLLRISPLLPPPEPR